MDNSIIYGYFKLNKKIENAVERYKNFSEYSKLLFWQQSFTGCPNAYDDNGNKIGTMPFTDQINNLDSYEHEHNKIIEMLRFKQHEFKRFIASLNDYEYKYLETKFKLLKPAKYDKLIEINTINECNQIEEASGYRYGFQNDIALDLELKPKSQFNTVLSILGMR